MKPKISIVYHSADLDGLCSGFLAKRFYRESGYEVVMHPWNYNDPIPALEEHVVMLDVSFPLHEMNKIHFLTWIDHHKTAIAENNQDLDGLRRVGDSASKLAWEYFYPEKKEPELVFWIDKYDVWKNHDLWTETLICQYDMRIKLLDPADDNNCQAWEEELEYFESYNEGPYQTVININSVAAKRAFDLIFDGVLFCALNHEGNSTSVDSVIKPHHQAILLFKYDGYNRCWVVSLYGRGDDLDLSAIATKYGGGGHAQACGFSLKDITKILG